VTDCPRVVNLELMDMKTELAIQQWLEAMIGQNKLPDLIEGVERVKENLAHLSSPEYWPSFPIDYLTRMRVLQAADQILGDLRDLKLVSSSKRNISRKKGEALFADLLYAKPEGSRLIVVEVKKDKATAREAITELLAYEHEIQNHLPFSSSRDILFVVVAREFPTLLDHAITGLITWGNRKILCLRLDDSGGVVKLMLHVPSAWSAVGQAVLPKNGLQIAHLCFYPNDQLDSAQIRAICSTASLIMAREAERAGGSGFVFLAEDIFFPGLSRSPYQIVAGALNPYCFLPEAERSGFASGKDSPISAYLLDETRQQELTISWAWFGTGGDAAIEYLQQFGTADWEGFSNWNHFRDSNRWRSESVTPDRHLLPLEAEFWGVLGDYARSVIINQRRLQNFLPGFAKPGLDWRCPWLAILVLDEIAVPPVIAFGEWHFSGFFALGMRLGRLAAFAAHYSKSKENERRKVAPGLFWAEVDIIWIVEEVRVRYMSAPKLQKPPPVIPLGAYDNMDIVVTRVSEFSQWIISEFIGSDYLILQQAFVVGLQSYGLYDNIFLQQLEGDHEKAIRCGAVDHARNWLQVVVEQVFGHQIASSSLEYIHSIGASVFGEKLPLKKTLKRALNAVNRLSDADLLDGLFKGIPDMMSCWHPQMGHELAPISVYPKDWDWYKEQIEEHRRRGFENPCILVRVGGQVGVGNIPSGFMALPRITDSEAEVLVVSFHSLLNSAVVVKWADLRTGAARIPGLSSLRSKKSKKERMS